MTKSLLLLTAALLASGCAVTSRPVAPPADAPAAFRYGDAASFSAEPAAADPWRLFGDPVLDRLLAQARMHNHDLRQAEATLAEALALRDASLWRLAPSGGGEAGLNRGRNSVVESGLAHPPVQERWLAGFDATWEIDLFGRLRSRAAAAAAGVGAAEASRAEVLTTVEAEVAANYFAWREAEENLLRLGAQSRSLEQSLAHVRHRLTAGRGTELDVARVEALLRETEALLPVQRARLAGLHHRLAVLVGASPSTFELPVAVAPPWTERVVALGNPANLLRRRPDIRFAERALAREVALRDSDVAALFPEVSVRGVLRFAGLSSGTVGDRETRSWGVAPSVRWNLLDLGRLRAQVRAGDARVDGAVARYEQTVLNALADMETALARYRAALERSDLLAARQQAADRALGHARRQEAAGAADPLVVLDAERVALVAERDLIAAQAERNLTLVALFKALGGGVAVDGEPAP